MDQYKRLGSGVPGKELSWVQMIGEIELYTDYSVLRVRTKGSEEEHAQLKNDAEALRQFVRGRVGRRTPHRSISLLLLSAIFAFLAHPEIGLLPADDLAPDNVPLILASSLRDYLIGANNEKKLDDLFRLDDAHFAGVALAHSDEIRTLVGRDLNLRPALAHGYLHMTECEERCIRLVEYITLSPVWERMLADSELPEFMLEMGLGSGRAVPMLKFNCIETSYTGIAIVISQNSAICFVKDVKGVLSRSFWIIRVPQNDIETSLVLIDCSYSFDFEFNKPFEKNDNFKSILEETNLREAFLNSKVRNYCKDLANNRMAILDKVSKDYLLVDKYRMHVGKILRSFDPYQQSPDQPKQQQQHQQEHVNYAQVEEIMREQPNLADEARSASLELLAALQSNSAYNISGLFRKGARFDLPDPRTGMTALHMLSNMGWRDGIRIAFKDKSRCDFSLRDKNGHLASYHATVYGQEPVISRLLRILERQHGVRPPQTPSAPSPR